ncbi:MAG: RNase adapter RapZ, partial [Nitrospirota bacterium]
MTVSLVSFGYKFGIPPEADLLFDVRFLPNPYFIENLKAFPGTSAKVKKFVLSHKATKEFLDKLSPLLNHIIPLYSQEGRSYLTIGIGCTGGRHRSPAIVQHIETYLRKLGIKTTVSHRDLDRASS